MDPYKSLVASARRVAEQFEGETYDDEEHRQKYMTAAGTNDISKLKELSSDPSEEVKKAVLSNKNVTPDVIKTIYNNTKSGNLDGAIADNPKTPPDILYDMAVEGGVESIDLIASIAANPNTPVDVLIGFSKQKNLPYKVLSSLGNNPSTPLDVLYDIADIEFSAVASNPNTPLDVLLDGIDHGTTRDISSVIDNPRVTDEILLDMCRNGKAKVRVLIADSERLTPEMCLSLSKDKDKKVRENLALNPECSPEVMMILATSDDSIDICSSLIDNQNVSVDVLRFLSDFLSSKGFEDVAEAAARKLYKLDPSAKEFKGDPKIHKKVLNSEQIEKLIKAQAALPEKESYSWGEINKALSVPSLPGLAQKRLVDIKDKSGRVSSTSLKEVVKDLVGGEHYYDIGLEMYSGIQTLHPRKSTTVIQLNITDDFKSRLKKDFGEGSKESLEHLNSLTGPGASHPVEPGKTVAWARVTDFPENKTLIIEELQSDVASDKNIKFYTNFKGKDSKIENVRAIAKLMSDWEFSALQAVKRFAEHKGYQTLYMVPGSVKSRGNAREYGYTSGDDTALKRVYDEIPAKVGFKKVSISELPDWLVDVLGDKDVMWAIETASMKVAKQWMKRIFDQR